MNFRQQTDQPSSGSYHPVREIERTVQDGLQKSPLLGAACDEPVSEVIVIIERRLLLRECLARALQRIVGLSVLSFPSVEDWRDAAKDMSASVVVLSVGNSSTEKIQCEIALLNQVPKSPPLVIFSDDEAPEEIVTALSKGVRGFIPTSVSLDVAVQAMRLVGAGGMFVPASSLVAASHSMKAAPAGHCASDLFTGRQMAVAAALSKGRSNKLIAYELNMCESTVKVHVRNIMKKLNARNRTEVAVRVNALVAACAIEATATALPGRFESSLPISTSSSGLAGSKSGVRSKTKLGITAAPRP